MFRVQDNVPEVYVSQSRDFQLFCKLYDIILTGVRFSIDSMENLTHSKEYNIEISDLLRTKLGIFDPMNVSDEELRYLIDSFPHIIRNKGNIFSIESILRVFQRITADPSVSFSVDYNSFKSDHKISIDVSSRIKHLELIRDILKYVIPTGYSIIINEVDIAPHNSSLIYRDELEAYLVKYDSNSHPEPGPSVTNSVSENSNGAGALLHTVGMTPTTNLGGAFSYFSSEGLIYSTSGMNDGECAVVGYEGSAERISIPIVNEDSLRVTKLCASAFRGNDKIVEVRIPNSVSTIENETFKGCTKLQTVTLPSSILSIPEKMFMDCYNLERISLPEGIQRIKANAFTNCTRLGEYGGVSLPDSVLYIEGSAFSNCTYMEKLTMSSSIKSISSDAFSSCSGLGVVKFKTIEGLTNWYSVALSNTSSSPFCCGAYLYVDSDLINTIVIPAERTSIRSYCFYGCRSIENLAFEADSQLTSIGSYAFSNCYNLLKLDLQDLEFLSSIEASAFYHCIALSEVALPASVTSIGAHAFSYCYNLRAVDIPEDFKCNKIPKYCFAYCYALDNITLPDSINTIGFRAFYHCNILTNCTLPDTPMTIAYEAFSYTNAYDKNEYTSNGVKYVCNHLIDTSSYNKPVDSQHPFVIRDGTISIASVGISASISEVVFPRSLQRVYMSYSLSSDGYTTDGNYRKFFAHNTKNLVINIHEDNPYLNVHNNCLIGFNDNGVKTLISYLPTAYNTSANIDIPDDVQAIGEVSFYNCNNVSSIKIPNSITSIGYEAFLYCYRLVEIVNNSSLTITKGSWNTNGRVGYYALEVHNGESKIVDKGGYLFYPYNGVNYLVNYIGTGDELTLPANYNGENYTINQYAFYNNSIAKLIIPIAVKKVGKYAFYGCSSLKDVYYLGSLSEWCDCEFDVETHVRSSNPISIADNFFIMEDSGEYTLVTNVTIPYNVPSIGKGAFAGYKKIRRVSFEIKAIEDESGETIRHMGCSTIGSYAFYGCTELALVEIPITMSAINYWSFYECTKLTHVLNLSAIDVYGSDSALSYNVLKVYSTKDDLDKDLINGCTMYNDGKNSYLVGYVGESLDVVLPKDHIGAQYTLREGAFRNNAYIESVSSEDDSKLLGIEPYSFYQCTNLKTVDIEFSTEVTCIDEYTFAYCSQLKSITMPNSITSIDKRAFYECSSLTNLTIPNSVTSIGESAFSSCFSLTNLTIPNSIISIGSSAFSNCYSLVEVINNSSLTITKGAEDYGYVGRYALEIHDGESKIVDNGGYIFYTYDGVNYLLVYAGTDTELTLPANYNGENYVIYKYAFYKNNNITRVTIPNRVTSIDQHAFYDCDGLTSVHFAENSNLKSIGQFAFYDCDSLTSIEIPNSVTSIGNYAFRYCSSLVSVKLSTAMKSLPQYGFANCSALSKIDIPNSVTSISNHAFLSDISLENVGFLSSETTLSISSSAFNGCSALKEVDFSYRPVSMPSGAFSGCSQLKQIKMKSYKEISVSVTNGLRTNPFSNCPNLESIIIEDNDIENDIYYNESHRALYYTDSDSKITMLCFLTPHSASITSSIYDAATCTLTIPEFVDIIGYNGLQGDSHIEVVDFSQSRCTIIGEYSLSDCTSLKEVKLTPKIQHIRTGAFTDNPNLSEVYFSGGLEDWCGIDMSTSPLINRADLYFTDKDSVEYSRVTDILIPDSITTLSAHFRGCASLEKVSFSSNSNCTKLSAGAFQDCVNLVEVCLPMKLSEIGANCFYNTYKLTKIENLEYLDELSIGSYNFYNCHSLLTLSVGAKVIGGYCFYNCYSLKSVQLNCIQIGTSSFRYCTALINVDLGSHITSIPSSAFWECYALTKIVIPSTVTSIGTHFHSNVSLHIVEMTLNTNTPPKLESPSSFYISTGCKFYILPGTLPLYSADSNWCDLVDRYRFIEKNV